VVHIFAMGSLATEALAASEMLLAKGIYANVIVVTSPDLLCGVLAHENDYQHLKQGLDVNASIYLQPSDGRTANTGDLLGVAGRRIPLVSVHDGEAGLLDNLGSIVGVKQISCAVRKHSKCGRPHEIYEYHGIDAQSVFEACGKVLAETAMENVVVARRTLEGLNDAPAVRHWLELWPRTE
jgi:pyruvate dehydrogenase E1 component